MLASFLYWLHVFGCPHAKTLVNLFLNTFCHLQPSKGHLTVWCALQCPPDYSRNTRTLLTSLASQITTHKYCQALSILFSSLSTISSFLSLYFLQNAIIYHLLDGVIGHIRHCQPHQNKKPFIISTCKSDPLIFPIKSCQITPQLFIIVF